MIAAADSTPQTDTKTDRDPDSLRRQVQPLLMNFQGEIKAGDSLYRRKIVFVMGATGSGKSRLTIELATRYSGEIINSDKMQVYRGLDILTNKVTEEETQGIPHHLMSFVDPDADFTAVDFCHHVSLAIKSICSRGRVPIIAGGSNSFIDALVNGDPGFQLLHDCCFIWVDVSLPVLHSFVSERIDRMVRLGLLDELRAMYDPMADNGKGIRRAIGLAELDRFFEVEATADDRTRSRLLEEGIAKLKDNTCTLTERQIQKIHSLNSLWKGRMHRIDATEVVLRRGELDSDVTWERLVVRPSTSILSRFLFDEQPMDIPISLLE